jgi:methyltransferase (TIGR00027 family)
LTFERVPADFGDAAADERLARDVAGGVTVDPTSGMARYLAARTLFFDRVTVGALERGIRQVVIAAAGYDGRPLRYARPDVRWFEVDHPDTQRDKRARLDALGIATPHTTFIAADFTIDDVAEKLEAAGLDSSLPALITVEGVAVYLELPVLDELLRQLRSVAAPGSRLVISLSVDTGDPAQAARRETFRQRVAAVGEPARTVLTVDGAGALFADTGWQVVDSPANSDRARGAGLVIVEPT